MGNGPLRAPKLRRLRRFGLWAFLLAAYLTLNFLSVNFDVEAAARALDNQLAGRAVVANIELARAAAMLRRRASRFFNGTLVQQRGKVDLFREKSRTLF